MTKHPASSRASPAEPHPEFRAARAGDILALAGIWRAGWFDGHEGHVPAALTAFRRGEDFQAGWTAQRLIRTTVAIFEGRVVGFVTTEEDQVEDLYVAPAARGGPCATGLLNSAEAGIGCHFSRAWLAVVGGNTRARRFYARNGWVDTGETEYPAKIGHDVFPLTVHRYEKALARVASCEVGK